MSITVYVCYHYLDQARENSRDYGTQIPIPERLEPEPNGLYTKSSSVLERAANPTKKYGHCRHFVKPFSRFAEEILVKIEDSNAESMRQSASSALIYPPLLIAAINCAEYHNACHTAGITSFPTILTYNMGKEQNKFKGAKIEKIESFVEDSFFVPGMKQKPSDVPTLPITKHHKQQQQQQQQQQ
eukprot:CAMPEP_0174976040 /NCGR_PEP_ID=MMETSP0004_2-20121128/12797_1 /TAXON_ID=420556 /ORGANISM="Ochromonas sp., Strain CCMP1393" /LENGTH=184 /DNA_ID=CAMNT_0016226997 /DNA_START=67 /DNA_END=619 /DNA_ORIENTATION=+